MVSLSQSAFGFALLGPKTPWMTPELGYPDSGGPMLIGEEYRRNVPVLTYGFDASFVERFGADGVRAVESAFAILNALPPMDEITDEVLTNNFPTWTRETNPQAQVLAAHDMGSAALSAILRQLGLASPEASLWVIRARSATAGTTNLPIVSRNYDVLSASPTNGINGVSYSYHVGPSALHLIPLTSSSVAGAWASGVPDSFDAGERFTGLTADDVGGLRHLYGTLNVNLEALPDEVRGVDGAPFTRVALRPGVNRLGFKPHGVAGSAGEFGTMVLPFTDTFIVDGSRHEQSLERVVSRPDFLITATGSGKLLNQTGTENWVSQRNPIFGSGPGTILGQARIDFTDLGAWFLEAGPGARHLQWGSFDAGSITWLSHSNSVAGSVGGKIPIDVHHTKAGGPSVVQRILVPGGTTGRIELQSSGDLHHWTTMGVVTNHNRHVIWFSPAAETNRFFKAVSP